MKKMCGLFVVIAIMFLASNSFAMDIGILSPSQNKYSAEVFYESFERDVSISNHFDNSHELGVQDEQRVIARVKYSPLKNWGLTLEAGATDSEYSEGNAPIFGLGSHVVVYANSGFYATLFAKATYAYDLEYIEKVHIVDENSEISFKSKLQEDYWEYAAGLQIGKDWSPCSAARITFYGGAMVSYINSDQEVELTYEFTSADRTEIDKQKIDNFDFEEDQPFIIYAGIEAMLTKYSIGIRAESRFYDRSSFSVGLFKNF